METHPSKDQTNLNEGHFTEQQKDKGGLRDCSRLGETKRQNNYTPRVSLDCILHCVREGNRCDGRNWQKLTMDYVVDSNVVLMLNFLNLIIKVWL